MSKHKKSPEQRLLAAARAGHVKVLKELLQEGSLNLNVQDDETSINFVVGGPFQLRDENYRDIPVPEIVRGQGGPTPLMWACTLNRRGMAEALLDAGADPKIANFYGETALHAAADSETTHLIGRMVRAGADVNAQNMWGATPLMLALDSGDMEAAAELIKYGADPSLKTKLGFDSFDIIRGMKEVWPTSAPDYENILRQIDQRIEDAKKAEEKKAAEKLRKQFRAAVEKKIGKLRQLSKTTKSIRIVPKR